MLRCRKLGVDTPAIAAVDRRCARIFMELIPGRTVREYLLALPSPIHEMSAAGALAVSILEIHVDVFTWCTFHSVFSEPSVCLRCFSRNRGSLRVYSRCSLGSR